MHRRIVVWIVDAASRSPYLTLAIALTTMLAFAGCARRLEVVDHAAALRDGVVEIVVGST